MDKKEMANELEITVQILSMITLAGDAVDAMAAAKQKIRSVRDELTKTTTDVTTAEEEDG